MVHLTWTGSRRIIQKAGRYRATIKSGVVTFKDDQATGELPGTVLRGERKLESLSA
jgi:D-aminoacylase, C-terminal region.